ncbi:MAG: hypothetical protein WA789_19015 [Candidatus Acidiferrum sp.]
MAHCLAVALCAASVFATAAPAQISSSAIDPIRVPAGTVLAFHLQTRLRHSTADPLDLLPQGTVLHVRILNSIDSGVDRDGTEFRGSVVSNLGIGANVVIHSDAEVQGLLVLLRSRNHPAGFRYELLLTELTDHGKSYPLTASLYPSFFDSGSQPAPVAKVEAKEPAKPSAPLTTRIPVNAQQ